MTYITYKNIKFTPSSQDVIDKANSIIESYQAQGYTLTLRQLYYQFVSKNWIENTERSYKRLGSIITDGRIAGEISWKAINDEHRDSAVKGEGDGVPTSRSEANHTRARVYLIERGIIPDRRKK